jgi:hypothetical protein
MSDTEKVIDLAVITHFCDDVDRHLARIMQRFDGYGALGAALV